MVECFRSDFHQGGDQTLPPPLDMLDLIAENGITLMVLPYQWFYTLFIEFLIGVSHFVTDFQFKMTKMFILNNIMLSPYCYTETSCEPLVMHQRSKSITNIGLLSVSSIRISWITAFLWVFLESSEILCVLCLPSECLNLCSSPLKYNSEEKK